MYFYIKGKITVIERNYIVLENNDIGYHIYFANPYVFQLEQEIKLFTYFYVKENIKSLYGFIELRFLYFFQKLISVPGIGPKSAISFTNPILFEEIQKAISANNAVYLTKFPGIGTKTAKQIVLHLQNNNISGEEKIVLTTKQKNVKEALINLGFKNTEINKVFSKLDFEKKIEIVLKEALLLIK
ncbi:holliday junction DNA helicase [Candidatus Phytoplasma luffae]|uniref:Holliday junction branch migration complex subunit RuvA n=1 Tax=Loofah witches'-broom phytoplasma TaxID=35773 RepID=A0A975FJE8_LOWBP|nr:Holliday junction branch migration protein RuvA [Candidatus Phytoplasma luffae]QTX02919.1 holliday junction DNA helicase [Candidatus Phytoplasma luffae]QTX02982.1 holliday junction DNA helicase [Candidatus Phytoplasma luffae]